MNTTNNNNIRNNPTTMNLQAIKERLNVARELVITPDGRLHDPNDPKVAERSMNEKVTLKPQRWF